MTIRLLWQQFHQFKVRKESESFKKKKKKNIPAAFELYLETQTPENRFKFRSGMQDTKIGTGD